MYRNLRKGIWVAVAMLGTLGIALGVPVTQSQVQLRSDKSLLSPVVVTATRGSEIEIVERGTDGWLRVRFGSDEGFLRASALDEPAQPQQMTPLSQSGGSNQAEAALAMKGIEPDVISYAGAHNYSVRPLEQMLDVRQSVSAAELARFKAEGGLNPR